MTTTKILWKRSPTFNRANNFSGQSGELLVVTEDAGLAIYDGLGNVYSAVGTSSETYWSWGGETSGYILGSMYQWNRNPTPTGSSPFSTSLGTQLVNKYSFTSDSNATQPATYSLDEFRDTTSTKHRQVAAYAIGNSRTALSGNQYQAISKMPFADESLSSVGQLDATSSEMDGAVGVTSTTKGYAIGGSVGANGRPTPTGNIYGNPTGIQAVTFSSDSASAIPGYSPLRHVKSGSSWSTRTESYWGHHTFAGTTNHPTTIYKFTHASESNATLPGASSGGVKQGTIGFQSESNGYRTGGYAPPNAFILNKQVDRFPFSSTFSFTDVGDLNDNYGRQYASSFSSTTNGYLTGGLFYTIDTNAPFTSPFGSHPYGQQGAFLVEPQQGITLRFPFANEIQSYSVGELSPAVDAVHTTTANGGTEV